MYLKFHTICLSRLGQALTSLGGQNKIWNINFQRFNYDMIPLKDSMLREKDPREIWLGIQPGSLINLHEKRVYSRTDETIKKYTAN